MVGNLVMLHLQINLIYVRTKMLTFVFNYQVEQLQKLDNWIILHFYVNFWILKYQIIFYKYIPEWLITLEDSRGEIPLFTGDIGLENEDVGNEVVEDTSSPYDLRFETSITFRNFLGGFDDTSILFVAGSTDVLFSIFTFCLLRVFLINRFFMKYEMKIDINI